MFLTHSCPIAASYPWLTPPSASCTKTRNSLTSRFSAFCFAGVAFFPQHWGALGVWPSSIVCFLFSLFQSPQRPGGLSKARTTWLLLISTVLTLWRDDWCMKKESGLCDWAPDYTSSRAAVPSSVQKWYISCYSQSLFRKYPPALCVFWLVVIGHRVRVVSCLYHDFCT